MEKSELSVVSISQTHIPEFPERFADMVAIDRESRVIYNASKKMTGDPLYISWVARCKRSGITWEVVHIDLDELAGYKNSGMNSKAKEVDLNAGMEVRRKVIDILSAASKYKASDVHITLRGEHAEIQFRIKGKLKVYEQLTQDDGVSLTRSLYQGVATVRDSSLVEKDYQNAQISGHEMAELGLTSVRIVRGPCYPVEAGGQFVSLRMQYGGHHKPGTNLKPLLPPRKPPGEFDLHKDGYSELQVELLNDMIDAPNGVILVTGPTGSGKTTTLAKTLTHIARKHPGKRQIAAEDPVEYPYPWAVQMVIANASGESATGDAFAEAMRVGLRMDPDVILLGEIRGPESAMAALNAALTGHLVLTTLHVNDAFMTVDRAEMMDMNRLGRRIFCNHKIVRGMIAQRIVATVCPHCSTWLSDSPAAIAERMYQILETYGDLSKVRIKGDGCKHCDFDGDIGRTAVAEVVVTSAKLMQDMIEHGTPTARKNHRALETSDNSILHNTVMKCLDGLIDPSEIQEVEVLTAKGEEDNI